MLVFFWPPGLTVHHALMWFFWFIETSQGNTEVCPQSERLSWRSISFILFLWHILILLSWGLRLCLKVRLVDINTTTNSKQCDKGHLCKGYSFPEHDFFYYEIPMRQKLILEEEENSVTQDTSYRHVRVLLQPLIKSSNFRKLHFFFHENNL